MGDNAAVKYVKDPRVDVYIRAFPEWAQAICQQVRDLVHAADPEVQETIKRTRQPYFVLAGNVCALLVAKDHVNVFLYDGGIVPDPRGIITGGHGNKTARTVAIREGEEPDAAGLTAMFRQIIANNRAGGWRKRKPASAPQTKVAGLLDALRTDPELAPIVRDFEARTRVAGGRTFGKNGLKIDGKLFALFTQSTLVVKLPKERVAALIARGTGQAFDPGHGRLMKEWLTVTSAKASWVVLAKEASEFVGGASISPTASRPAARSVRAPRATPRSRRRRS